MINILTPKRPSAISHAFCVVLTLLLFAPGLLYAAPVTQIFVLHSYSQEYPWTRGQHEGFLQTLAADPKVAVSVSTEYLDTKRRTYDETYAADLARHLRIKYQGYKPTAIYVTDDNALLFARDHLSRIFPGAPVFFSAVNDYDVRNSLDPAVFTGVFELKEVAPNIELLLRLDKNANDLVFIGDGSNTYQAIEHEARKDLIPYRLRVAFIAEKKLDIALARLRDLPGKYLVLTTLGGMTDANGQVLPLRDIMKRLALTGRIVISMEDAYILEGVLGGYVTSARHQGTSAARLVLAHLHGKPVIDLPPVLKSPNAVIFDDRVLHQYNIKLPESLRPQAVLLNPRPGFYEQNRFLILGSLIGLILLLFLVVTGALVIMSRKKREVGLARISAESANILFNQLAEQSRTVNWEANAEGLYTSVSPVSYAVLGYRPEELVGKKHFYDLLPEEERDADKTAAFKLFAKRDPFHNQEMTARTKDGRPIWVSMIGIPLIDDRGTFLGYRGSDSDITERKQIEEALRESEQRSMSLVENSLTGVYVGQDDCFLYVNKTAALLTGYTPDELIGKQLDSIVYPEDRSNLSGKVKRMLSGEALSPYEFRILTKDGQVRWMMGTVAPINFNNTPAILGNCVDITDRRQREVIELHSQKLESVGQLAAGIAHEINTPIQFLGDNIHFMQDVFQDIMSIISLLDGLQNIASPELPSVQALVDQIRKKEEEVDIEYLKKEIPKAIQQSLDGLQRVSKIVLAMKEFSHPGGVNKTSLDINKAIETTITLTRNEWKYSSDLITTFSPDLPEVQCYPADFNQVILNLIVNAAQAVQQKMGKDGASKGQIEISTRADGDEVEICIRDTGTGIPPEAQARVFDPFFTTKEVGKGTGQGLSIARNIIVQKHGGKLFFETEIGKGTTFYIRLPRE